MLLADPITIAICVLSVFLIGLAKGGFAGVGALSTPLLTLVLPPATAAALLLPLLLAQDVLSVWAFRHSWDRWIVSWMVPGMALGVFMGWAFSSLVNEQVLMGALGFITLMFGAYRLWLGRGGRIVAASTSPGWVGSLFGLLSGFTSQIAHAGGPPFQMWVAPRKLPHLTFVGTSSMAFAAMNMMKVPSYIALGVLTPAVLTADLWLLPLAIASTWFGIWLLKRINAQKFYTLIYLLMVVLGGKLTWDGLVLPLFRA